MPGQSSSAADLVRVKDILESIRLISGYCANVSQDAFLLEPQLQDAVARRLIIIGEAATRLSQPFRDSMPEIPWRMVMGMRHVLVHDYGRQSARTLWQTAKEDLVKLKSALSRVVRGSPR